MSDTTFSFFSAGIDPILEKFRYNPEFLIFLQFFHHPLVSCQGRHGSLTHAISEDNGVPN
jgi:hypothetical protein